MADFLYTYGFGLLGAGLDWASDPFTVAMVNALTYDPNVAHQFLSSVPVDAIVCTAALQNKGWSGVAATANDVSITPAASGALAYGLLIYHDTTDRATSELLLWIDSYIGLPTSPDGDEIEIIWPHGPERIFTSGGAIGVSEGVHQYLPAAAPGNECTNPTGLSRNYSY